MALFNTSEDDYISISKNNKTVRALKLEKFDGYNPSILGLGDVKQEATSISAISAIFDLQGFTNFCKQIDPQLSVPVFLSEFLDWIFSCVKEVTVNHRDEKGVYLWHGLPLYSKFTGDGLLLVWSSKEMNAAAWHNLLLSLLAICKKYKSEFLPKMNRKVVEPPSLLRCGVARGTVLSVGNGNDYVGSCINLASRLQKMSGVSFSFSARGFDPENHWKRLPRWVLKKVAIPGIGDNELIYLLTEEFEALSDEKKEYYREP